MSEENQDNDAPDVILTSEQSERAQNLKADSGQAGMTNDSVEDAEKIKAERDEYLAGWQRTLADLQNYKKQVEKEKEFIMKIGSISFLAEILPMYNSLKKAVAALPQDLSENSWAKGVLAIKKQFDDLLVAQKVSEIKTQNEIFNPEFHEAITHEESDLPEGQVIEEVEPGYLLEDKVLVPAKVRVSKGNLKISNG